LANFDLNAAVSSAKKQHTPPSNHYSSNSSRKSIPSNPYHSGTPNNLNNKLPSKPPPQYPNPSTKSTINPMNASTPSSNQKIQIDLNEYKVLREEAEVLRQEKQTLQMDISTAKQKKKDLDKDIIFTRTENDMLKKESKSLRQQIDKMKGGREDHTKMKSDLKSVKTEYTTVKSELKFVKAEHKTVKSELKSAKAEKEKYEKEAGLYKKEVSAIKAELNSLKKEKQSATKAKAKSTGEDADQPPKKKQKTGAKTGAKGTTIIKSMKVGDLKDEAAARGIDVTGMNKDRLLERLGVGSILIHKTDEWKEVWGEVVLLREKFKKERQVDVQMEQERQHQLALKRHQKQMKEAEERQKREQEEEKKERAAELASQVEKHKHHYPKVHGCKLAKTDELMFHGKPRTYERFTCSECNNSLIKRHVLSFSFSGAAETQKCHGYTCEGCDYDICQDCFKEKTMTPEEKKAEAKRKAKEERERLKREEEEEAQHRAKWDAKQQFKSSIINPPSKNLDPDGNKMKGFTVWCSDGYGNDGWHSYEGPPTKEFDATYKTKEEANNRARYLFHWKNPWGLGAEEMAEGSGVIDKSVRNELVTYEITPDDSTTWTVGVVPDAAYAHLDNASSRRHGYDREYKSYGGGSARKSYYDRGGGYAGMGELFY